MARASKIGRGAAGRITATAAIADDARVNHCKQFRRQSMSLTAAKQTCALKARSAWKRPIKRLAAATDLREVRVELANGVGATCREAS